MPAHTFRLSLLSLSPLLLACGGEPGAAGRIRADMASPSAVRMDDAEPPAPIVGKIPGNIPEEQRFSVEIDRPERLAVGAAGLATIKLTAHEPWHVNLDYPTSMELTLPGGFEAAQRSFEKHHARRLDEQGFEYELAFTATRPGDEQIQGRLFFAVCEEDACVPVKHDINFAVAVQ